MLDSNEIIQHLCVQERKREIENFVDCIESVAMSHKLKWM